jgi:uncharacterized protein YodC (DUF2158 family)
MPAKKSRLAFEIGATVQLRSGGPALTVLGQAGDRVHCVFFSDEIGEFRETMLPEIALEAIDMEEMDDAGDEEGEDDEEEGGEDEEAEGKAA